MQRSDPLERLRGANPVPLAAKLPAPDPVLFHRIVSGRTAPGPERRSRRSRSRRLATVVVVMASLLGGTVAYALLWTDVTKPQTVACYASADPEADTAVVAVDVDGPVDACADLWRRGVLGGGGPVPALQLCVLESGVAAVAPALPGRDTCVALAGTPVVTSVPSSTVAPPSGEPPADVNARVLALRDALLPQFLDVPCVDPQDGAVIVRRELDRAGLGDWEVRDGQGVAGGGFSPERPCVTLSLRPDQREVLLVPAPPRR